MIKSKYAPELLAQIKQEYEAGLTVKELFTKFDIREDTIIYQLKKMGLYQAKNKKLTPEIESQIIRLFEQGKLAAEIARIVDRSPRAVVTTLAQHNLREIKSTGETQISDDLKEKIGKLRADGMAMDDIAAQLNLKHSTVKYICNGILNITLNKEQRLSNTNRKYSKEKIQEITTRYLTSGSSRAKVAEEFGMTDAALHFLLYNTDSKLTEEELNRRKYECDYTPEQESAILAAWPTKNIEISKKTGLDVFAVARILQKHDKMRTKEQILANVKRGSQYTWQDILDRGKVNKCFPNFLFDPEKSIPLINKNSYEFICGNCKGKFMLSSLHDFLYGKINSCGCLVSRPQQELTELVQSWGFNVESNKFLGNNFKYDILIKDQKLIIEYDGLVFHGETGIYQGKVPSYHFDKMKEFNDLGFNVINIFSNEWQHKRSQVVGWLRAILNIDITKIGARECEVRPLKISEVRQFLNDNHLQGCQGHFAYGLYYKDNLISCATFKRSSISRKGKTEDGVFELTRFCNQIGFKVHGGLGKLLKYAIEDRQMQQIISYSNNRWSVGKLYKSVGFTLSHNVKPNYYYFKRNQDKELFSKSLFRKSNIIAKFNGDPNKSEWELMQENGYDRIWDCGLKCWMYNVEV